MSRSNDEGWSTGTKLPAHFEEGNYRYQKLRGKNWSVERYGSHGWEFVATINGDDDFVRVVSERMGMTDHEIDRAYSNLAVPRHFQ